MNLRKLFLVTLIMSGEAGELESMPSSSSTPQHPVSSRDIIMYIVYTRAVHDVSRKFSQYLEMAPNRAPSMFDVESHN